MNTFSDNKGIALFFHNRLKKIMKSEDKKVRSAYEEGAMDVLDAIAALNPNLVFEIYTLRQTIEDMLEEENGE